MATGGNRKAEFRRALRTTLSSRKADERLTNAVVANDIFDEVSELAVEIDRDEQNWRFYLAKQELDRKRQQRQFISEYGFIRNQTGFKVCSKICECGRCSPHYLIVVGEKELCPYSFMLIISKLNCVLPDRMRIGISAEMVKRIQERTAVK